MINNIDTVKDMFPGRTVIDKIDLYELVSGELKNPDYPEGDTPLSILKIESEEMYGKNLGNIIIKISFEDEVGNRFNQVYILKNGKNNNFAKFIFNALGYEPEGQFSINDLVGKKIMATISHFYNEQGLGYANIAFCRPA
ncbi:hypothetical protein [Tissierella sp. Yu-01]|uniref:hypothetical protein n=1 Tax=Tissierella sp. Yu-01 TaxID=3035694 RepID=UPI00240E2AC4|nr:hypothetical protein [Tissierella sp. Yu-01]WFA09521.1 hypothetical protein P3962_02920 [Tissierella sp. Yu-01]